MERAALQARRVEKQVDCKQSMRLIPPLSELDKLQHVKRQNLTAQRNAIDIDLGAHHVDRQRGLKLNERPELFARRCLVRHLQLGTFVGFEEHRFPPVT